VTAHDRPSPPSRPGPGGLWRRVAAGLSRDALLLCLSTLLGGIPYGALAIVLPIYLKRIRFDALGIGVLFSVSGVVSAVLLFVLGILADRFSRKPFLVAGTLMPAVSYLLFLTSTDPRVLAVASAVGGVGLAGGLGGALAQSAFNALLASLVDDAHRTRAFSLNETAWALALMVGSIAAGLPVLLRAVAGLGTAAGERSVFVLALVLALAAFLVLLPVREPPRAAAPAATGADAARPAPRAWLPQQSRREILQLSLVLGALGLGLGFITQLLPLWFFLRFHADEAALGPWYAVAEAGAVAGTLLAPALAARLGSVRATAALQVASAVFLLAMAFSPVFAFAAVLLVARQAAINTSWPIQQAYAMSVVVPDERAAASSSAYGTWGLASSLSPALGGRWLQSNLFALPFIAGAGCYAISGAIFVGLFGRRDRRPRPSRAGATAALADDAQRAGAASAAPRAWPPA
jgi:MFS family permease